MGIFKNIQENLGIGKYNYTKRAEREIKERNKRWAEEDRRREERMAELEYTLRQREYAEQERKQRLANENQERIRSYTNTVNTYKTDKINKYLKKELVINAPGESVSLGAIKHDGDNNIDLRENIEIEKECKSLYDEICEIEKLISKIDNSLKEPQIAIQKVTSTMETIAEKEIQNFTRAINNLIDNQGGK